MYTLLAKSRVAPEEADSHRSGFALHLVGKNTREVFMENIVKICKFHGELLDSQVRKIKQKRGIRFNCLQCEMESQAKTYEKYKEERLERARKYRAIHKERLAKWARDDRARNKAKYQLLNKNGSLGRNYPKRLLEILKSRCLTKDQYDAMIEAQNNKCAICNQTETCKDPSNDCVRRLSIDHNHTTGEVRELLCHSCNSGIGKFKEDIELLRAAIAYIEKHNR